VGPVFEWLFFSKVTFEQQHVVSKRGANQGSIFFQNFFFKVPKINIEHEHDGLEDDFSFQTGDV